MEPIAVYQAGRSIFSGFLAYQLGVQITALDLPWAVWLKLNALSMPITILWLVGIANAVNFIDGLDGLVGGVSTLSALTLAVVAVFTNQPLAAIMAALLAGASLGFLVYNTHPARIFMGDGGSLFIGFMLAAIAITGRSQNANCRHAGAHGDFICTHYGYGVFHRETLAGRQKPFCGRCRPLASPFAAIGLVSKRCCERHLRRVCDEWHVGYQLCARFRIVPGVVGGMALLWFALVTLRFSTQQPEN
ncbi:MAG: MraY family glycosyltransferase [Vampirovibrionales bacterium]